MTPASHRPGNDRDYPGTPRWVKAFAIVVLVLVLLVVIIMATGVGGEHGPGRHRPPGGAAALSRLGGDLLHPGVGLVVLLVITALNVYKPRGLTPYGWRKQRELREAASPRSSARYHNG